MGGKKNECAAGGRPGPGGEGAVRRGRGVLLLRRASPCCSCRAGSCSPTGSGGAAHRAAGARGRAGAVQRHPAAPRADLIGTVLQVPAAHRPVLQRDVVRLASSCWWCSTCCRSARTSWARPSAGARPAVCSLTSGRRPQAARGPARSVRTDAGSTSWSAARRRPRRRGPPAGPAAPSRRPGVAVPGHLGPQGLLQRPLAAGGEAQVPRAGGGRGRRRRRSARPARARCRGSTPRAASAASSTPAAATPARSASSPAARSAVAPRPQPVATASSRCTGSMRSAPVERATSCARTTTRGPRR